MPRYHVEVERLYAKRGTIVIQAKSDKVAARKLDFKIAHNNLGKVSLALYKKTRGETKMKAKLPKGIKDIKTAFDACYLIISRTKNYTTPSICPEDDLIHTLREMALKGMTQENEKLKRAIPATAENF
jgi:hypothetical protein